MKTLLVVAALVGSHHVQTCHLAHGSANGCSASIVRGSVHQRLGAHRSLGAYDQRAYLWHARVNGRRGHWNRDHDQLLWLGGRVSFDGVTFWNWNSRPVRVAARFGRS